MNKNIKLSVIALGAMLLTPTLVKSNEKVALAEDGVQYVVEDQDGKKYSNFLEAVNSYPKSLKLLADIKINQAVDFEGNLKSFDFNGHKVTCSDTFKNTASTYQAAFYFGKAIYDYGNVFVGTVTIKDSVGTGGIDMRVDDVNGYVQCIWTGRWNANVIIESGTFIGLGETIYSEDGNITINGGTFSAKPITGATSTPYLLNCLDANFASGSASITVNGGTFIDYDPVAQKADKGSYMAEGYTTSKVVDSDGTIKYVANIAPVIVADAEGNNKYYSSLQDAVKNAKNGETITLRNEAATDGVVSGGGVVVPAGSNFTLDLNGLTYCVSKDMVGSAGSETNGFQLLKDSNITIKNGTLTKSIDYVNGSMLIQNYSNLTLDNAKLIGTSNIKYVVSNNYGNVTFKNSTEISATEGNYAFDAYFWPKAYEEGVTVTIADDTVKINGKVGYASGRQTEKAYNKVNIIMPAGYQLTLDDGLVLETSEDGKTQEVTTSDVAAAKDFASLWKNVRNSEGGLCAIVGTSAMDDLLTKFDNLSATSKEYLESVQDADGVTVAYSVNYFKTLQQTKASTSTEPGIKTTLLNTSSESNNVAMIVLFAMLGIAGVVSYYYIEKSKVNN